MACVGNAPRPSPSPDTGDAQPAKDAAAPVDATTTDAAPLEDAPAVSAFSPRDIPNVVLSRFGTYAAGNSFDSLQPTQTVTPTVQVMRVRDIKTGDVVLPAVDLRYDGNPRVLALAGGTGRAPETPAPNETRVGDSSGSSATSFGATVVFEAMIFARALTDAEVLRVEAYAKARHGIQ